MARKIYLIRHGKTRGNLEKRYVGRTDEGLCEDGIKELLEKKKGVFCQAFLEDMLRNVTYDDMEDYKTDDNQTDANNSNGKKTDDNKKPRVYITNLCRTKETADLLFGDVKSVSYHEVDALREVDFGEFEYANYEELKDHPAYQEYIDTNGESTFPKGESKQDYICRCVAGFMDVVKKDEKDIVMVVHGGTIMALMSALIMPHKDYFAWQVKNGEGFIIDDFGENDYRLGGLLS